MSKTFKTEVTQKTFIDLDMLSFVSHELKTPLSTMKLNVELLKKQTSPEQQNLIKILDEEVAWMIQFISDTLDLKKVDNKAILNLSWHKWNKWIKSIQDSMEQTVHLHKRNLKIHLLDKEREVYMDPLYIRQVLFNLIINAIKYSFKNSLVEILCTQTKTGELNVEIKDQGPGINLKSVNKIFEPFYQDREKAEIAIKGSGLGLTIVKKIIEAQGGHVNASNRPDNKGAVFKFTLPRTRAIFK
ncbi:MAG: HAMP domain-containing sensor histidine kinase [Bdellovibrionales bacterium]|nr:HAMP domain-containing sensor histidine kinase [Bdellovibrionales bacterium]